VYVFPRSPCLRLQRAHFTFTCNYYAWQRRAGIVAADELSGWRIYDVSLELAEDLERGRLVARRPNSGILLVKPSVISFARHGTAYQMKASLCRSMLLARARNIAA